MKKSVVRLFKKGSSTNDSTRQRNVVINTGFLEIVRRGQYETLKKAILGELYPILDVGYLTNMEQPELLDSDLKSALIITVINNNFDCTQLLLANGANPNYQDITESTALHYATENENAKIMDILIKHGGDPTIKNAEGNSPIDMVQNKDHLKKIFVQYEPPLAQKVKLNPMLITEKRNYKTIELPGTTNSVFPKRKEYNMDNARIFSLQNLLSKEECNHYIEQVEKIGFDDMRSQFPSDYRSNDRILILSNELADLIWDRIAPQLRSKDIIRVRPMCFGNGGTWKPYRLNECFKIAKYVKGRHFSPHLDGPWVPREDESSIYTVVIYLNSDYKGGETNFLDEKSKKILYEVKPETGKALIFTHDTLHEGKQVEDGVKYIMRTEIMFKRVDREYIVDKYSYRSDPNYLKALSLYKQSYEHEYYGRTKEFTDTYLKALELQRKAQSSVGEDTDSIYKQIFPYPIFLLIFSYLEANHLVKLMSVNKNWYDMSRDSALWKPIYLRRWPDSIPKEVTPKVIVVDPNTKDWFGAYKARYLAEKSSSSIIIDFGSKYLKFAFRDKNSSPVLYEFESIVANVPGICDMHIRRINYERFYMGELAREKWGDEKIENVIKTGNIRQFGLLLELIAAIYMNLRRRPAHHHVVIAEPPFGWNDLDKDKITRAFENFGAPSVTYVNSAILAVLHCRLESGITIFVGEEVNYIAVVWKKSVLSSSSTSFDGSPKHAAKVLKKILEGVSDYQRKVLANQLILLGGKSLNENFVKSINQEFKESIADFTIIANESRAYDVLLGGVDYTKMHSFSPKLIAPHNFSDYSSGSAHFYYCVMESNYYWGRQLSKVNKT